MNLGGVGQTFLSAGSGDFPVARSANTGRECPVNWQAGKPALRVGSRSQCMRKSERGLSLNHGWFGVPPLGGSNGLDRLKPGLQAVRGSRSQCAASKSWRLSMNLNVGQAFQPAGLPDFPVWWTKNGRLESRPNPQAGKVALLASPVPRSQCICTSERVLPASCRQRDRRKALPARCRQHLGFSPSFSL